MSSIGFFLLFVFFAFLFVFFAGVLTIVSKQNRCPDLGLSVTIAKIEAEKKEAKISMYVPYLKRTACKLKNNKANRDFLKQTLRWDFLMLAMCTKCFDKSYVFYVNTWVFDKAELDQMESLGFTVKDTSLLRRISAKTVTAVSFWRLHKNLKGFFKLLVHKKKYYKIMFNSETANDLHNFFIKN